VNGRVSGHVFNLVRQIGDRLPDAAKYGVLVTEDSPQESVAFELIESRGGSGTALRQGWSLDAVATRERAGLGVAKDLFASHGFEVDAGVYATQRYEDIFRGKLDPQLGIGMHVSF